jgi:endonuclease III related protein
MSNTNIKSKKLKLKGIYNNLVRAFGFQNWWPADTAFEVCVGAILTQNTAWTNVKKALGNLKQKRLMTATAILSAPESEVREAIKPAGFFNQKTRYLVNFCRFLSEHPLKELRKTGTAECRRLLLSVKGIGKETADSILLYALDKPVFVVDAYTKRIFSRMGFVKKDAGYDELQKYFHDNLEPDVTLYKDFHAQIVMLAKTSCRKKPSCRDCVLKGICIKKI